MNITKRNFSTMKQKIPKITVIIIIIRINIIPTRQAMVLFLSQNSLFSCIIIIIIILSSFVLLIVLYIFHISVVFIFIYIYYMYTYIIIPSQLNVFPLNAIILIVFAGQPSFANFLPSHHLYSYLHNIYLFLYFLLFVMNYFSSTFLLSP